MLSPIDLLFHPSCLAVSFLDTEEAGSLSLVFRIDNDSPSFRTSSCFNSQYFNSNFTETDWPVVIFLIGEVGGWEWEWEGVMAKWLQQKKMNERAGWSWAWVGFLFTGSCVCVCVCVCFHICTQLYLVRNFPPWDCFYTLLYAFKSIPCCQTELKSQQSHTFGPFKGTGFLFCLLLGKTED